MGFETFALTLFGLFMVVVLVIFGILAFIFIKAGNKAKKMNEANTQKFIMEGFSLDKNPSQTILSEFKNFLLFRTGFRHKVNNVLIGNYRDREWKILELLRFNTVWVKTSQYFTVFSTEITKDLPTIYLANNSFVNKPVFDTGALSEVSFEDNDFSKKYFVLAEDKTRAKSFFNEKLRAFLMEKNGLQFRIETQDNKVIAYLVKQVTFYSDPIKVLEELAELVNKFEKND